MLFEDLTADVSVEQAPETAPAARLSLLDAYWQDLLSSRRDEPPAPKRSIQATAEPPSPVVHLEIAA